MEGITIFYLGFFTGVMVQCALTALITYFFHPAWKNEQK